MKLDEVIAEGQRQADSQDGSHVVLDGYEWAVLLDAIKALRTERDGLCEIIERYEEIKATVTAQVFAGDAIRKASEGA